MKTSSDKVQAGQLSNEHRCERIKTLLLSRYVRGASGENNTFDCWGLVVTWLAEDYALDLPALSAWVGSPEAQTEGYDALVSQFVLIPKPVTGAVACVMVGGLLEHVGIVLMIDEQLRVLHTSERRRARLDTIRNFERLHNAVEYRLHRSLRGVDDAR